MEENKPPIQIDFEYGNWDKAEATINQLNNDVDFVDIEYGNPKWSWDCFFKLDYDGGIVVISSRFYPSGSTTSVAFEGTVSILLMDKIIQKKEFKCENLTVLKQEVDEYVNEFLTKLRNIFTPDREGMNLKIKSNKPANRVKVKDASDKGYCVDLIPETMDVYKRYDKEDVISIESGQIIYFLDGSSTWISKEAFITND